MAEMLSNISERLANLAAETLHDCIRIEDKMQALKNELQNLTNREIDVLSVLEDEEIRTGRKRKREVKNWLDDVVRKKVKCESLDQEVHQTRFYNFLSRLHLGKRIKELRLEVGKLVDDSKFTEGYFLELCQTKGKPLVTTEYEGQQSVEQNFRTVWAWLMNDVDTKIGIYGMGGVGKTTLAMRIHNKLLNEPKFRGHVYWVHVSQDLNVSKLQNDIAVVLNLDLSSESYEKKRAALLFAALKRRKKFVLILDDVWNHIDIENIGIPIEWVAKNLKVKVLGEEEAWELFLHKLGYGIKLPTETEQIAKEVAKRCAGLPLGIITMGGSMRGVNDIHEWRDALEELRESSMGQDDMETKVYPILLCSFNRLRDPKLQHCFLYCSLYPEDPGIPRDELISKFIAEELMDKRKTRQACFDQGHAILNKLVNASLLERADNNSVRMHDLIRDMALRATLSNIKFMVKVGIELHEVPDEHEWTEMDKISLMFNKISEISPLISPNCHRLTTLIFRRNPLERIHDSFFLHMHDLKVLDLSYTWIESLPKSISYLENLNVLLLSGCVYLKYVPSLEKLKELKELELNRTQINELPIGMENLVNLRSLNIGYMNCLEMIQEGMLPKLFHLQRLIISDNLKVCAEELEGLKYLEEFQGLLPDVHTLNKFITSQLKFGKLSFYNIVVGDHDSWSRDHPESKRLTDKLVTFKGCCFNIGRLEDKILLPHDIQDLKIAKCDGLKSCLSDIFASLCSLRTLKSFRISHCVEIEYILRLSWSDQMEPEQELFIPFQNLEKIIISWSCNLISLIKWDFGSAMPPHGTFSVLKELRIEFCNKIKKLFTLRVVKCLTSLENVFVSECAEMQEIIGDDEECSFHSSKESSFFEQTVSTLPKLRSLSLKWLPQLKSICRGVLICDSVEIIGLFQCHKLNRLSFFLPCINGVSSPLHSLKQIRIGAGDREWWESLEWNDPNDKNVLQPFVKCLNLGFQASLLDPGWKKLFNVFLFIRRLQLRARS